MNCFVWLITSVLDGICGVFYFAAMFYLHPLPAVRRRITRWGCAGDEATMTLPGDEAVRDPYIDVTHAVTVRRPPSAVWPWIVQLGCGRGGFYSYDCLENAIGCMCVRNADRIVPEWQGAAEGDELALHPVLVKMPITIVDLERHFVSDGPGAGAVWGWHLIPVGDNETRLLCRYRLENDCRLVGCCCWKFAFWRVLFEPVHHTMQRKQLLGIKRRAELSA